jgi:hypothetical protein
MVVWESTSCGSQRDMKGREDDDVRVIETRAKVGAIVAGWRTAPTCETTHSASQQLLPAFRVGGEGGSEASAACAAVAVVAGREKNTFSRVRIAILQRHRRRLPAVGGVAIRRRMRVSARHVDWGGRVGWYDAVVIFVPRRKDAGRKEWWCVLVFFFVGSTLVMWSSHRKAASRCVD